MKLKVICEYFDLEQDEMKHPGDILTVSDERGSVLVAANVVTIITEPAAPAKKPAKRTAKK